MIEISVLIISAYPKCITCFAMYYFFNGRSSFLNVSVNIN